MVLQASAIMTLVQTTKGPLRVTFSIGPFSPNRMADDATSDEETVALSVLVDTRANPPLLAVQHAALKRARQLLLEQLQAIDEAMRSDDD